MQNKRDLQNAVPLETIPTFFYGRVLQGGLGVGTLTKELLKRDIEELVTLELDREVIEAYGDDGDDRHVIIYGDFTEYLEEHEGEFDFIVHDLPLGVLPRKRAPNWIKTGGWRITNAR